MSLISLRLSDDLTVLLSQEAKLSKRPRSDIARTAIADYLKKQERERFMAAYVKSAARRDPTEALKMAEEFLPLENEATAAAKKKAPHNQTLRTMRRGRLSARDIPHELPQFSSCPDGGAS